MRRVVITGMGIVSPVGTGVEYAWKNVVAGNSGIRKIDTFDVSALATQIGGIDRRRGRLFFTVDQREIFFRFVFRSAISTAGCRSRCRCSRRSAYREPRKSRLRRSTGISTGDPWSASPKCRTRADSCPPLPFRCWRCRCSQGSPVHSRPSGGRGPP